MCQYLERFLMLAFAFVEDNAVRHSCSNSTLLNLRMFSMPQRILIRAKAALIIDEPHTFSPLKSAPPERDTILTIGS